MKGYAKASKNIAGFNYVGSCSVKEFCPAVMVGQIITDDDYFL